MADQGVNRGRTLEMVLESTLESVDSAEEAVLGEAKEAGFDEDDLHKIGISVRECLVNAVVHGNRYNARKKVQVKVGWSADRLSIDIADEGEGFDPASLPNPLEGDNLLRDCGRGVLLMRSFMDEFQIHRREPKGTEVKMVKYLKPA